MMSALGKDRQQIGHAIMRCLSPIRTLRETRRILGIPGSWVSQIERRALWKVAMRMLEQTRKVKGEA